MEQNHADLVITIDELRTILEIWERINDFFEADAGSAQLATAEEQAAAKTRRALIETGVELSEIVYAKPLKKDKTFAYYYLPVPLSVFPPTGTFIKSVEVELQFSPGSGTARPVVRDIFPSREFQDQLVIQGGVQVGIDESLKFVWAVLGGAAAQMSMPFIEPIFKVASGELKLDPAFTFLIRKPIILTDGIDADVVRWRFNGRDHFEQPEPLRFGVVFAVPRELKQVRVAKSVKARRRNQSLQRLIAQDLERIQRARELLKGFYQERDLDLLVERLKQALRSEWNVVQDNLPMWILDSDMVH